MRRRQLKGLWARLKELHRMSVNLTRDELLIKLGQAKAKWPTGWRLVEVDVDPKLAVFRYALDRKKLRQARRREGRYLLRSNLTEGDPATLWSYYLQLGQVEEAFRNLKGDLAIRPPMICPPNVPSVRTRLPNSASTLTCDPRPLLHALTAASVLATIDWTLRRTTRRLGVDRRAAFQRQGSEVFDALHKKRRHRRRADLASRPSLMLRPLDDETRFQMLRAESWYPTIASLGLSWSPVLADAGLRR